MEQERITVREGPAVERDYGALTQNDPFLFSSIMPANCTTSPGCDTIPLSIVVPPGLRTNEDFFVRVTLSWDTSTRSNLQLYIWNDPPPNDPEGQRIIGQSATEEHPERVVMYRPSLGKYFIVVYHTAGTAPGNVPSPSGPNTGYHLRLEMTFQSFDSPFEVLATDPPTTSPVSEFDDVPAASAPSPTSGITPLPLAPLNLDADFDGLTGRRDALAALESARGEQLARPAAARPPAGPVNGWLLTLWAGIVPAVVVGGGLFWLRRRAAGSLDA